MLEGQQHRRAREPELGRQRPRRRQLRPRRQRAVHDRRPQGPVELAEARALAVEPQPDHRRGPRWESGLMNYAASGYFRIPLPRLPCAAMEPQRLQEIRSLIESFIVGAPYGRRLGVVLEELVEPDRVRIRLPYTEDNTTIADVVHGGAIASLVDVAATAACWASPRVAPGARGTTI